MTQRAAKGGQIGANGEWYEGGKFINTIPENGKKEGSRRSKPRKVEIEPYVWVYPPEGRTQSIYRAVAGIYGSVDKAGVMQLRTDDRLPGTLQYFKTTLEEVQALIARYNAGERWV